MCGIIGFIGRDENTSLEKTILQDLLQGLEDVKTRGYDNAGLAILQREGGIFLQKSVGEPSVLAAKIEKDYSKECVPDLLPIGISHTRWSTHGSKLNCHNTHPHYCEESKIFVVHNGQIENYSELKAELISKGLAFYSETDTEVIPKLIQEEMKKGFNFLIAFQNILPKLKGAFALLAIHSDYTQIVGATLNQPLLVGICDEKYVFASENKGILRHTDKAVKVQSGTMFVATKHDLEFTDFEGNILPSYLENTYTIEGDINSASKGDFPHIMLKEIYEQPHALRKCMGPKTLAFDRFNFESGNAILGGLKDADSLLRRMNRVIIIGVGTSYFAGMLGKLYFEKITQLPTTVEQSPDFPYNDPVIDPNTLVIVISQSGESVDTLNALREAKIKGAYTIGICNKVGSAIAEETDAGVYCHIGEESAVASTMAFIAQCTILLEIAIYLGRQRRFSLSDGQSLIRSMQELPALISQVLELNPQIEQLAEIYANQQNMYVIGRKYLDPIAQEGALKIKEITYLHAEGYNAGVQKHGPIALIDENFLTIALCPLDSMYKKMLNGINQIVSNGGQILAITSEDNPSLPEATHIIRVPKCREKLYPFLIAPVLQLFAYNIAVKRGLNPDLPRNLAKSVTVE